MVWFLKVSWPHPGPMVWFLSSLQHSHRTVPHPQSRVIGRTNCRDNGVSGRPLGIGIAQAVVLHLFILSFRWLFRWNNHLVANRSAFKLDERRRTRKCAAPTRKATTYQLL